MTQAFLDASHFDGVDGGFGGGQAHDVGATVVASHEQPGSPQQAGRGSSRWLRRLGTVVGDVVLTVGAIAGTVCIVAAAAAFVFGFRIVLFGSGSMAPTIPQGAAAVVLRTPAADIAVGDIVTVDRVGELPVTHRVVAVEQVPGLPDAREIVMRGDANPVDDPQPYVVTSVGRLVAFAPGMAPVVAAVSKAPVLLGATVVAAGLVLWAFWPRRREP